MAPTSKNRKRKPSTYISRTFPRSTQPLIKRHASMIGEIAWAWNSMHSRFLQLFCLLVDKDHDEAGAAIWHSQASDRGQREMLLALAKYRLTGHPDLLTELTWVSKAASDLSGPRNAFVHAPMKFEIDDKDRAVVAVDAQLTTPRYAAKLNNLSDLYRKVRGDLIAVDVYITAIALEYVARSYVGIQKTLPKRPLLQSTPEAAAVSSPKRRPPSTKPPRPPSTSRP